MKSLVNIVILICCIGVCYLLKKNSEKDIVISQLSKAVKSQNIAKKDSLLNLIEQERFKENFYSTQLSIQNDWTIFYVTVLFSLFGIIGYSFFAERINSLSKVLKSEFETKIEEHKNEYIKHRAEFHESKRDIYLLSAGIADSSLMMNLKNDVKFIFNLWSASNYLSAIEFDEDTESINIYIKASISRLKKSLNIINNITEKDSAEFVKIKDRLNSIHEKIFEIIEFNNTEIKTISAEIITSLKRFSTEPD